VRDDDQIILESLYKTVNEQNTDIASDAGQMAKRMFQGAYGDWKSRQEMKASGVPYETSGILWIRPTFNGNMLPFEEIKQFKATVNGGTIRREEAYSGQKDPDILPCYIVQVDKMSNETPLVTIESPRYKSEPIPLKVEDTREEVMVPVTPKD
jgi:hypothetical protein